MCKKDLKPCPWCLNTHEEEFAMEFRDVEMPSPRGMEIHRTFRRNCSCGGAGPWELTVDEADRSWNERVEYVQ